MTQDELQGLSDGALIEAYALSLDMVVRAKKDRNGKPLPGHEVSPDLQWQLHDEILRRGLELP